MKKIDIKKLLKGDIRTLAKAITLVESKTVEDKNEAFKLLNSLETHSGKSIRIAITGVPGVGKSTFIDVLGSKFSKVGKKVAVLTIDPTSPIKGGSLLGDKSRMLNLSQTENVYIRPGPCGRTLGGVASRTFEAIKLCEAAGFDLIIVETVGVGQSEFRAKDIVDFFLLMVLPNSGDEIQGIKKGIVELADLIVINKADGSAINQAKETVNYYSNALNIIQKDNFWTPSAISCSSKEGQGIDAIINIIDNYIQLAKKDNQIDHRRKEQQKKWMRRLIHEMIIHQIENDPKHIEYISNLESEISEGKTSPLSAAKKAVKQIL